MPQRGFLFCGCLHKQTLSWFLITLVEIGQVSDLVVITAPRFCHYFRHFDCYVGNQISTTMSTATGSQKSISRNASISIPNIPPLLWINSLFGQYSYCFFLLVLVLLSICHRSASAAISSSLVALTVPVVCSRPAGSRFGSSRP